MDKLFDIKTLIHVAIESLAIGLLAVWFNNKIKKLEEKVDELEKVCAEHRNAISGILQHLQGAKKGGGKKKPNRKVPDEEQGNTVSFEGDDDEILSRELDDIKKSRSARPNREEIESEEGHASGSYSYIEEEEDDDRLKKSEADD